MGKASKWFRVIFGLGLPKKQSDSDASLPDPKPARRQPKKRWSFVKSSHNNHHDMNETSQHGGVRLTKALDDDGGVDPDKYAIAVAAATAAVAEAAVAAAHAATAVVKLTSSGRATSTSSGGVGYASREYLAAVKIQSHFRAYLSRRALRALRALVRLQALVRGHIARKQTAEDNRRMQALLRVQAKARAGRSLFFESPHSASKYIHVGPPTPEKFEHGGLGMNLKYDGSMMLKRSGSKSNGKAVNDLARAHWREQEGSSARSDEILEVDTGKPHIVSRRRSLFHSTHLSLGWEQYSHSFHTSKESHPSMHSHSSGEVQSSGPLKLIQDIVDDSCYYTADSSPQFYSASSKGGCSKRGPFTPTKSDGSRSCLSGYSDQPNYMSFTESSKAKIRSQSAPKQRPNYERSSSTRRYLINSFNESGVNPQRVSALHVNFANKAYPGSGRLDRLGMPVGGDPT